MLYWFLFAALLMGMVYVQLTVNIRASEHLVQNHDEHPVAPVRIPKVIGYQKDYNLSAWRNYTSTDLLINNIILSNEYSNDTGFVSKITPLPPWMSVASTTTDSATTGGGVGNVPWTENPRAGECHVRKRDGRLACAPDFFFIGTSKAGTTSLAYYLDTHPMIVNANGVNHGLEGHRFDPAALDSLKGVGTSGSFIRKFDIAQRREDIFEDQPGFLRQQQLQLQQQLQHRPLVMDYTPNYLMVDEAPALIAKTFPEGVTKLKFLVMVREPVARMISSWRFKTWQMHHKHIQSTMSFKEAVDSGVEQIKCVEQCLRSLYNDTNPSCLKIGSGARSAEAGIDVFHPITRQRNWRNHLTDKYHHMRCSLRHCRHIKDHSREGWVGGASFMAHAAKSLYAYQLLNWFSVFDRRQFLIISLEEFTEAPEATLRKITGFLGLHMYHREGVTATATSIGAAAPLSKSIDNDSSSSSSSSRENHRNRVGGNKASSTAGTHSGSGSGSHEHTGTKRSSSYNRGRSSSSSGNDSKNRASGVQTSRVGRRLPYVNDTSATGASTTVEAAGSSRNSTSRHHLYEHDANIFLHKDDQYIQLKDTQQSTGRMGWSNEEQLKVYLSHILNNGQMDFTMDNQITPELIDKLQKAYSLANSRFIEMMGWPKNYY